MRQTQILFLVIATLGCYYSQQITLPLTFSNGEFFTNVKYGKYQCPLEVVVQMTLCTNYLSIPKQNVSSCGADTTFNSKSYLESNAPFSLGKLNANLDFVSPNVTSVSSYSKSWLCFGKNEDLISDYKTFNTVIELYNQSKISEKMIYLSLNNSTKQNSNTLVGQLDIGQPDQSLISQGSSFVKIQSNSSAYFYNMVSNSNVTIFGQVLQETSEIFFNFDSSRVLISYLAYNRFLNILKQKGITFTEISENKVVLNSIEKLEPLVIPVLQNGSNQPYIISLHPSQYTMKLNDGAYQLLIKRTEFSFHLPFSVFESYYAGFNVEDGSVKLMRKTTRMNMNNSLLKNIRGERE